MKIETYIDSLVSYAMNCGLTEPEDHIVATNRLLDLLEAFRAGIDAALGEGACHVLSIRPQGGVEAK